MIFPYDRLKDGPSDLDFVDPTPNPTMLILT